MNAVTFDTLKLATARETAGFSPQQAKGAATAFAEAIGEQIPTKTDLKDAELRLEASIPATKVDLKQTELRLVASISDAKAEILKWMFGTIGFQTIIILGAVVALSRFGH